MATAPRLEPFRPTPQRREVPPALRDPVRLLTLVGAVALFLGSLLSWIEIWLPGLGWQEISSFERAGDGAIALEIGLVLFAITWADRMATSRNTAAIVLPLILGVASLGIMKLGWDSAQDLLAGLAGAGGHGDMLPGFWITLAGAVLATIGGLAHLVRLRREVDFSVRVSRASLVGAASGVIGAVVGIGAAIVLGEDLGTNPTVTGSAVTFLSIVFALVGAWLGAKIGRSFVAGPRREES